MMIPSYGRILKSTSFGLLAHIYPLLMLHENGLFQMFRVMGRTYFGKTPRKTINIIFIFISFQNELYHLFPNDAYCTLLHHSDLNIHNQPNFIIELVAKVFSIHIDISLTNFSPKISFYFILYSIELTLKCMIYVRVPLVVLWELD